MNIGNKTPKQEQMRAYIEDKKRLAQLKQKFGWTRANGKPLGDAEAFKRVLDELEKQFNQDTKKLSLKVKLDKRSLFG